jgi:shikimate kinase
MIFYNLKGKKLKCSISEYKVDWDKKVASNFQFNVKQFFREYWEKHFCFEEFPCFGTKLRIDLFNLTKRIAVEVHGDQHVRLNKFFHKNSQDFFQAAERDRIKEIWCEQNQIQLVEIYTKDLPLTKEKIIEKYGNIFGDSANIQKDKDKSE